MVLWIIAVIVVWTALWVLVIRDWVKQQSWAKPIYARLEPIEIWLWNNSRTILWARFQHFLGILLIVLQYAGTLDLTPFLAVVDAKWHPYIRLIPSAALILNGLVTEVLRRETTQPLAVTEVPTLSPVPPEVAEKVDASVATAVEAQAVIKMAQMEGRV